MADPGLITVRKMALVGNVPLAILSAKYLELHSWMMYDSSALTKQLVEGVESLKDVDPSDVMENVWAFQPPKVFGDLLEAV